MSGARAFAPPRVARRSTHGLRVVRLAPRASAALASTHGPFGFRKHFGRLGNHSAPPAHLWDGRALPAGVCGKLRSPRKAGYRQTSVNQPPSPEAPELPLPRAKAATTERSASAVTPSAAAACTWVCESEATTHGVPLQFDRVPAPNPTPCGRTAVLRAGGRGYSRRMACVQTRLFALPPFPTPASSLVPAHTAYFGVW